MESTVQQQRRGRRIVVGAAVAALVVLGGAACSKKSGDVGAGTTTTTTAASTSTSTTKASTTTTAGDSATTATSGTVLVDQTWDQNATDYRGQDGLRLTVECAPNGTIGSVWGTDVYTDDSSICTAAVHAGLLTVANGGTVVVEIRPGQDSYAGSDRNGVTSSDYGAWDGSYVFVEQ